MNGNDFVPDPRSTSACSGGVGMHEYVDCLSTQQGHRQQQVVGMDFASGNGGSCNKATLPSQGATARTDVRSAAWSQNTARDPHRGALPRHPPPVQPALPQPAQVPLTSAPSAGPGDEIPFLLNESDTPAQKDQEQCGPCCRVPSPCRQRPLYRSTQ